MSNNCRTIIGCFILPIVLLALYTGPAVAASSNTVQPAQKTGILWQVPDWVQPNLQLEHPRVQYTQAGLQNALDKLEHKEQWALNVYNNVLRDAAVLVLSDEQIRSYIPEQYAYFKYSDTMLPCPDGSAMVPSWGLPGKVTCGGTVYPNETHPDDGRGWRDAKGTTHYFVARWNGFVVEYLTNRLPALAMAYALTGDEKYARTVITIMDSLATIYPTTTEGPLDYPGLRPGLEGGRLDRPYYQTARRLLLYVDAIDLIWHSELLDAVSPSNPELTIRDNIVYNMLLNGADYCWRETRNAKNIGNLHNGTADYNKGLLAVGSLLGIEPYVDYAVNGPTSFAVMIANNIDGGGHYYETTTNYTDYARTLYLQIANIMYNLRIPSYPQGINYYADPRFAAMYTDARESLFVAGRSPAYGDTEADTAVVIKKPFDADAATQIVQFAVRSTDETAKARYWDLVAEGTNGLTVTSILNPWGLFNIDTLPPVMAPAQRQFARAEVIGEKGLSILRSGDDRGALLRYGPTLNHGQRDELSLLLYTHGREMSFDPGYQMAHYRAGWTHQTVSHITTVVNETSQQGAGGSLGFSTSAPGFSATEAYDAAAYAHQGVEVYRRLVSLIDSSPTHSYVVDIFRIKGGKTRDYSFHSWGPGFTTQGLDLSAPGSGSVASPYYTWHDKIGVDGAIVTQRNQAFYWLAPPGNGYGFLGNPQTAAADQPWSATWDAGDRKLRLSMLPAQNRELTVADAPGPMLGTKYLLAREQGDAPSQFVSVIDMTDKDFTVERIDALDIVAANPGDFAPVAFTVTLANTAPQIQDVLLSSDTGTFSARGAHTYQTDAELASVRWAGTSIESMHVAKGTHLQAGSMHLAGFPKAYTGSIVAVDYQGGSILVSSPGELPAGIVGATVLISAAEYSHNSAYQIRRVENEGEYTRLYLFPTTFDLGKGQLNAAPQGKQLPNFTPLALATVIYRTTPGDRFNGKIVVNQNNASALIERVAADAKLQVDETTGFAAEDTLTIYDIKAGDDITIPVAVHLTKADALSYQLDSPQPIWLSLGSHAEAHVYVTDETGEFVFAQSEVRDGLRWYKLIPGSIILQPSGQITGVTMMHFTDVQPLPQITVQVEELATHLPITGAQVQLHLAGRLVELEETATGGYSAWLPAGITAGSYDVIITAQKEGLQIYNHALKLQADASWQLQVPDRVEVSLGAPSAIALKVIGGDTTHIQVQATSSGQYLKVETKGADEFAVIMPPITEEQTVLLYAAKTDGLVQEARMRVQPGSGVVVPLHKELRIKAGETVVIEAQFLTTNGVVLKGEQIPYSNVFYGFRSSELFTDPDGDGIASTTLGNLRPGTQILTIWADGCDPVDITVIVEE